jgi:hypothetical protein
VSWFHHRKPNHLSETLFRAVLTLIWPKCYRSCILIKNHKKNLRPFQVHKGPWEWKMWKKEKKRWWSWALVTTPSPFTMSVLLSVNGDSRVMSCNTHIAPLLSRWPRFTYSFISSDVLLDNSCIVSWQHRKNIRLTVMYHAWSFEVVSWGVTHTTLLLRINVVLHIVLLVGIVIARYQLYHEPMTPQEHLSRTMYYACSLTFLWWGVTHTMLVYSLAWFYILLY